MKNIPLLLATIIGSLVFVFGIAFFFSRQNAVAENRSLSEIVGDARNVIRGSEASTSEESSDDVEASESAEASDEPAQPPADQVVITVTEFSDFQCPACKAAAPIKDQLISLYPDNVEFIYRHFPLTSIHPNAPLAAQAAEAAAGFGKFWEMHDMLFERQLDWTDMSNAQAREAFISYAEELEIPNQDFTEALDSDTVKTAVQSDINDGNALQVNSTPTFYVNTQKVSAPEVLSTVQQLLQE